jgi:hypothetical protein
LYHSRDRTAVIYGKNILSFRAIFNDVRNSIDRVHHTVRIFLLMIIIIIVIKFIKKKTKGKLKEIVCENIEQYIHRDEQLPVLLDR